MPRFALLRTAWDGATIASAAAAAGDLDASALLRRQPGDLWRTTDTAAQVLTLDLGAAAAVDAVALLYTNLTDAAQWRVRAAASVANLTAAPVWDSGMTAFRNSTAPRDARGWSHGRLWAAAPVNARHWRIDIADAANPDGYLQAGRVMGGTAWSPAITIDRDWTLSLSLPAIEQESEAIGGQTYVAHRRLRRYLSARFSWLSEAEAAALQAVIEAVGRDVPLLAVRAFDGPAWDQGAVYGRLVPPLGPVTEPHAGIWHAALKVEEMLP